nr:MAG: putative nucleocapsid [Phasmaviridae sp. 1]
MQQAYQITSATPHFLTSHAVEKTEIIMTLRPEDFMKLHAADDIDMAELIAAFKKILPDYTTELRTDVGNMSLWFSSKVIYEVGPESRKVKKGSSDKVWRFVVPPEAKGTEKVIFIATFKNNNTYEKVANENQIVLTIKQATLLAVNKLSELVKIAAIQESYILTPLAGAIFSRLDLTHLTEELNAAKSTNIGVGAIVDVINSSCTPGGQYLPNSRSHVAAVSAVVATQNIKDPGVRNQIIAKTVRQYINAGKIFDMPSYVIYAKYATSGVPQGLDPISLLDKFRDVQQMSKLKAAAFAKTSLTDASFFGLAVNLPKKPDQLDTQKEDQETENVG